RAPTMRSPEELAHQHYLGCCPYALARAEIARAALNALLCVDTEVYRKTANAEIDAAAQKLPSLRSAMQEMVERLMRISEAQQYAFDHEVDGDLLIDKAADLAAACSALEELEQPLIKLHIRRSQENVNANVWRIGFAGSLFSTWWRLTGRDPTATEI